MPECASLVNPLGHQNLPQLRSSFFWLNDLFITFHLGRQNAGVSETRMQQDCDDLLVLELNGTLLKMLFTAALLAR